MKDLEPYDHYQEMNKVVKLYLQGTTDPNKIAKQIGMKRAEVVGFIDEWREIAKNDQAVRDRAQESIIAMDRHFDIIIEEQWAIVNDIETDGRTKANTLKQIADVEAKRQDVLQKAGLYDDIGMADQIADMQKKYEQLKKIVLNVAREYPDTKAFILRSIGAVENNVQTVDHPIEGEVVN
jgi:hypothetical protein